MAETSLLFMKLSGAKTGLIEGQAELAEHKNWIELDNWTWGLEPKADDDSIEPAIFCFSKLMDAASPTMLKAMGSGDELSATIVIEDGSLSMFELTIHLQKARITKYDLVSKVEDKRGSITEEWEFDYETIVLEYRPDARSAPSIVRMRRPPGAATESSQKKTKEIIELARGLDMETLDDIWLKIKAQQASGETAVAPPASTPKSKQRSTSTD